MFGGGGSGGDGNKHDRKINCYHLWRTYKGSALVGQRVGGKLGPLSFWRNHCRPLLELSQFCSPLYSEGTRGQASLG